MRTAATLALLCLAACGSSSKPDTVGNATGGGGGPAGPPPTLTWSGGAPVDGGSFATAGLPAVADDGSRVVVAWQKGDGGRGYPNLTLRVIGRDDRELDTRVVLDANLIDDMYPEVDVTLDNEYLATTHQQWRWRPLAAAEVAEEASDEMFSTRQSATVGDLSVRFDDGAHLVIEHGGKVVVDAVKQGWLAADRPMYDGAPPEDTCSNPIFLEGVHADAGRRLAVILVGYRGTDTCWEPSSEHHVVSW
jgi:hypothetical protein